MGNESTILEWIKEESNVTQTKTIKPERKSYDKKIVAWIDILGIRSKINNEENDAETILDIMRKLNSFVKGSCDSLELQDKLHFLQIADGFMIVADLDICDELCSALCEIQWKILSKLKMLARGAVTVGNVSVSTEDTLIIGPAYVEAYKLESEISLFSRVILDTNFINEFPEMCHNSWVKEDVDKFFYLDFLKYIMLTEKKKPKHIYEIFNKNKIFEFVNEGFCNKNRTVSQKYGWFISLMKLNNIDFLNKNKSEVYINE